MTRDRVQVLQDHARRLGALLAGAMLTVSAPVPGHAQAPAASAPAMTVTDDAREEVQEATAAFRRVTQARAIPPAALARAEAIAVFDDLVQAAFIVGGRGGDGVLLRRVPGGGWSAPVFVKLGGASVGAQIGGSRTDVVMLFMDRTALDALAEGRLEFGTEFTAVAGPRSATAETLSKSTREHVLVYTRDEGLFAGAAFGGAKITLDEDLNREVYGDAADKLLQGQPREGKELTALADALKNLAKPKGSHE